MDAAYIRAYYPNGFSIFNELPLHLCNINLFLSPAGRGRETARSWAFPSLWRPLAHLDSFPEPHSPAFAVNAANFRLLCDPRNPCCSGLESGDAGLLPPCDPGYPSEDPQDLWSACRRRAPINLLLRLTACPEANYFFYHGKWETRCVPFVLYPRTRCFTATGTADSWRLYVRGLCVVPPGRKRAEEVSFHRLDRVPQRKNRRIRHC